MEESLAALQLVEGRGDRVLLDRVGAGGACAKPGNPARGPFVGEEGATFLFGSRGAECGSGDESAALTGARFLRVPLSRNVCTAAWVPEKTGFILSGKAYFQFQEQIITQALPSHPADVLHTSIRGRGKLSERAAGLPFSPEGDGPGHPGSSPGRAQQGPFLSGVLQLSLAPASGLLPMAGLQFPDAPGARN